MTRDDIMRWARESGGFPDPLVFMGAYERFANLVAAHKTEVALAEAYRCGYEAGVAAERDKLQSAAEWCRMCERKGVFYEKATGDEANSPEVLGEG